MREAYYVRNENGCDRTSVLRSCKGDNCISIHSIVPLHASLLLHILLTQSLSPPPCCLYTQHILCTISNTLSNNHSFHLSLSSALYSTLSFLSFRSRLHANSPNINLPPTNLYNSHPTSQLPRHRLNFFPTAVNLPRPRRTH